MTTQELKKELDRRLADIRDRIQEIEDILKEQEVPNAELKDVLDQLRELQKEIVGQYEELGTLKKEDEEKFDRLEKTVFSNLESWDEAFLKAGSMIKQSKFASRDRSVDFKNPPGTK